MRFPVWILILLVICATAAGCLFAKDAVVGTYSTAIENPYGGGTLAVFNTSGTFFLGSPPYAGKVTGTWKRLDDGQVRSTYSNGKGETIVIGSKTGIWLAQEIVIQGKKLVRISQE